ncbi:MAG: aminopeptidase, partial [Alistipes sp.]|nr:aminopeptidase [Alistipes sp.]
MLTLLAIAALCGASAQTPEEAKPEGYVFTDAKVLEMTPVKDQNRSGTCWCYSTLSFLEGEILRAGGAPVHLSEMWIVRHTFMEKAEKYVRMHGELNFAEGGAAHDVTEGIKKYGIVPFEVYPGLNYGTDKPDFHELTAVFKAYLDTIISVGDSSGKPLSTAWRRGFDALLDAYFGELPATFTYEGKEYTPASYAASLPIDMEDYIDLTSFTHHPFYSQFILEVPDNWMWGTVYNLPLDEMMAVIDHALATGHPVAWGTDVSEKGFSRSLALGIVPEADLDSMSGTEAERWGKLTQREKEAALYKFEKPGKERVITQQMRQEAFDNYETTDDHGMVIVGTAHDQAG